MKLLRAFVPCLITLAVLGGGIGVALGLDKLTLGALWPLLLLPLLPWAWWVHLRGRGGLGAARSRLVGVTRLCLLFALLLALCEPRTVRIDDRAVVVFAFDRSDSIQSGPAQAALRFALEAAARKAPADEAGLVFFARNAGVELPPATALPFESVNVALDRSGTDLGEGLATAAALLPPGRPGRVVLASDGVDTAGQLDGVLADLAARGVPVDVLPVEYGGEREVWIEKVELPLRVQIGETVAPGVLLGASAPGRGEVVVTDNDVEIARQRVEWAAGKTRLSVSLPMRSAGYHELRAQVIPESGQDFWAKNNEGLAGVYVAGRGRVLIVRGTSAEAQADAELLFRALSAGEREVEVVPGTEVPGSALQLLPYDAIAIVGCPRDQLPMPPMQAIHDAVFHQGSGLLMFGSPDTFGPGGYRQTPIEEALPVSTDLPEKKKLPKGALAIVLHTCEFDQGNTWAKRITLQAIKVLHPKDEAGVLAYGYQGAESWIAPMQPAANYEAIAVLINGAQIGDMPGFANSLQMAHDALLATDAAQRHVIVISDGDPSAPPPGLLAQLQAKRISVSTVTVFPHGAIDLGTMQAIADATGGRHYRPSSATELPAIFIKEAKTTRAPAYIEQTFTPKLLIDAPVVKGIGAVPPLHGLVLTTPKGRALTVLEGPDDEQPDPVLAQWRYGVGAAIAFTSDLGGRWGRDYVAWSQYRAFVQQLFADVQRQPRSQRLFARALAAQGTGLLQVEDHGSDDALLDLRAELRGPGGARSLSLTQVGPRRYEARFPVDALGRYEVTVAAGDDRAHAGFAVPYGMEYARFRSDPECLRGIAARTGGRVLRGDESAAEVFARPAALPRSTRPWLVPLLVLCAALLLLEVAFRRVQIDWRAWRRGKVAPAQADATDALLARKRAVAEARQVRRPTLAEDSLPPASPLPPTSPPPPAAPPPTASEPAAQKPAPPKAPPSAPESTVGQLLARKRKREGG